MRRRNASALPARTKSWSGSGKTPVPARGRPGVRRHVRVIVTQCAPKIRHAVTKVDSCGFAMRWPGRYAKPVSAGHCALVRVHPGRSRPAPAGRDSARVLGWVLLSWSRSACPAPGGYAACSPWRLSPGAVRPPEGRRSRARGLACRSTHAAAISAGGIWRPNVAVETG